MSMPAYFLDTGDLDGPTNMALDEVLWHEAAHGSAFLRFYGWCPRPTISLGYFQSIDEICEHAEWGVLPIVRRLTGGGAIVHDDELTYSLALPAAAALQTNALYERVHRAFEQSLRSLGIPAQFGADRNDRSTTLQNSASENEPAVSDLWTDGSQITEGLKPPAHKRVSISGPIQCGAVLSVRPATAPAMCFSRSDRFAVHLNGEKILGSAQRRQSESVLMHGSLLLGRSSAAPANLGLADLLGRRPDERAIRERLRLAISQALGLTATRVQLPRDMLVRARELAANRFANAAWTERPSRFRREVGSTIFRKWPEVGARCELGPTPANSEES